MSKLNGLTRSYIGVSSSKGSVTIKVVDFDKPPADIPGYLYYLVVPPNLPYYKEYVMKVSAPDLDKCYGEIDYLITNIFMSITNIIDKDDGSRVIKFTSSYAFTKLSLDKIQSIFSNVVKVDYFNVLKHYKLFVSLDQKIDDANYWTVCKPVVESIQAILKPVFPVFQSWDSLKDNVYCLSFYVSQDVCSSNYIETLYTNSEIISGEDHPYDYLSDNFLSVLTRSYLGLLHSREFSSVKFSILPCIK